MGKDVRGIDRGKCACGECEDQSRVQMKQLVAVVAVCRLAVLNGTSGAGTSESASPKKWKDEGLGWYPNPKGEYTDFFFSD